MPKLFNNKNYYELVILIFSLSNYQKEKAVILVNYALYHLMKNNFNVMYEDRLIVDLGLIDPEDPEEIIIDTSTKNYKKNLELLHQTFNKYEIITFKATLFELLEHSFNR